MIKAGISFLYLILLGLVIFAILQFLEIKKEKDFNLKKIFVILFIFLFFSTAIFLEQFLSLNFQITAVYENTSFLTKFCYRFAAPLASRKGSIFLFFFLSMLVELILILKKENKRSLFIFTNWNIVLAILVCYQNPFAYIWQTYPTFYTIGFSPVNGLGLNPQLKNFWQFIHPPLLFGAYAITTITVCRTLSALWENNFNYLKYNQKPILLSLFLLTATIISGGIWAYQSLGWGGFWGWDPVENLCLISWLANVIVLHAFILFKKNNNYLKTYLNSTFLFYLSILFSLFFIRSGLLDKISIHAFGSNLEGITFLIIIIVVSLIFILFYYHRKKDLPKIPSEKNFLSTTNILYITIFTFYIWLFFILVATILPVFLQILKFPAVIIEENFYIQLSFFLCIIILLLLNLFNFKIANDHNNIVLILTIISGIILILLFWLILKFNVLESLLSSLSIITIFLILKRIFFSIQRFNTASFTAHFAFCLIILSIIFNLNFSSSEKEIELQEGKKEIISKNLTLSFSETTKKDNTGFMFNYEKNKKFKQKFIPFYKTPNNSLYTKPLIIYSFFQDVYITPLKIIQGIDEISIFRLKEGETIKYNNLLITLQNIKVEKNNDQIKIRSLLKVQDLKASKTSFLSPTLFLDKNNPRSIRSSYLPSNNQIVLLQNFDLKNESIDLYIEPKGKIIPKNRLLLKYSNKSFTFLLLISTILLLFSFILAIQNLRIKELLISYKRRGTNNEKNI